MGGALRGESPCVQCNPFLHLVGHCLVARPRFDFCCGTVPPFQQSKCLLDVSSPEFGFY